MESRGRFCFSNISLIPNLFIKFEVSSVYSHDTHVQIDREMDNRFNVQDLFFRVTKIKIFSCANTLNLTKIASLSISKCNLRTDFIQQIVECV